MPRTRKLKSWAEEQREVRKAREEAFEAIVKANPELYRSLKKAVSDAEKAYREIDAKYRILSQAQSDAPNLRRKLLDAGLSAHADTVSEVLAEIDKAIEPLLEPLSKAIEASERAQSAFEEHFPDEPN